MTSDQSKITDILTTLRRPLLLTRAGMVAEQVVRAFWPFWSVLIAAMAALMLGLQDLVATEAVWAAGVVTVLALLVTLWRGVRSFRWPTVEAAILRLDRSMPGNPIQTALDRQAIGGADAASAAVWQAHQARMRARLAAAKAVEPDLRVSRADPFALRYAALLALAVALVFGSFLRVGSVTSMGPGAALASGPAWEGWVEPPGYTQLPALYLNDIKAATLEVPEGSRITLRFYGEAGALSLAETVSGRAPLTPEAAAEVAQEFTAQRSGRIEVMGQGGRLWEITVSPDASPTVALEGEIEVTYEGEASIPFKAADDYGVVAGTARIALALGSVDRSHGLGADPEPREAIEVPLTMPIAGDRTEFSEALIENFSEHPWANLPVTITLSVSDAAQQSGSSGDQIIDLPGRNFFDPMAAAVIEQRRDLLWTRENAPRVAQILRAVSHLPDDVFRSATAYLRLRTIVRRIEVFAGHGMTSEQQQELADAMWDLALLLEEGDLQDALERLQRAQDRLSEAMKNGASDEEIAELMQELRNATDDYLRQLSRQAQQDAENDPDRDMAQGQNQDMMEMSQNDLQRMMDRIQELMEQGRMAEAQEALEELRRMMENMQVTQGQGQGGQSPGEQAMEGLSETLRDQQGLSDEAFRDLQDQFNPGQQGQQGQQGQGQGQQFGQNQPGQGQGQGQQGQDQQGGQGDGEAQSLEQDLAERQRALRDELGRQRRNLPGLGDSEAGERAADALRRAEEAMEGAEEALRSDDLAEAIDQQSDAMEALREGIRNLGEALAEQQGQQGQEGTAEGGDPSQQRDPLGRNMGSNGNIGTDDNLLQGEDVYRRARELLDEIRRRTGEGDRPELELDYLERLLERF